MSFCCLDRFLWYIRRRSKKELIESSWDCFPVFFVSFHEYYHSSDGRMRIDIFLTLLGSYSQQEPLEVLDILGAFLHLQWRARLRITCGLLAMNDTWICCVCEVVCGCGKGCWRVLEWSDDVYCVDSLDLGCSMFIYSFISWFVLHHFLICGMWFVASSARFLVLFAWS